MKTRESTLLAKVINLALLLSLGKTAVKALLANVLKEPVLHALNQNGILLNLSMAKGFNCPAELAFNYCEAHAGIFIIIMRNFCNDFLVCYLRAYVCSS